MVCGAKWVVAMARFNVNLRQAYDGWAARTGGTVQGLAEQTGIPKRTIDTYLSRTQPVMPPANNAVKLARALDTSCEALECGENATAAAEPSPTYSAPYQDIIPKLNRLPESYLRDLHRIIAPWANQARGAAQNTIDVVADLKVLSKERLDDVRRLIDEWPDEERSSEGSTERAQAVGE